MWHCSGVRLLAPLLTVAVCASLILGARPQSASAQTRHCGNPPNWSGRLIAINVSCHRARVVFHHIRCLDSACREIHSRAWECYRHHVSHYAARGNCHLEGKRIRWLVFE